MGPLTSGLGTISDSAVCHWVPFPVPGLPGGASLGEEICSPVRTRWLSVRGDPSGASCSLRAVGEGFVRAGLRGEAGCYKDMK